MRPEKAILRTIGLPFILLSAIFIGTHCNKGKKVEKKPVASVEVEQIEEGSMK